MAAVGATAIACCLALLIWSLAAPAAPATRAASAAAGAPAAGTAAASAPGARTLGWNAVVDGVPGAGYVRPGAGHQGPVTRLLAREDLRALDPGLVVVQAGHDDSGVPASLERQRVGQAIGAIRARGAAGADRAAHRLRRAVRTDRGPVPGQ